MTDQKYGLVRDSTTQVSQTAKKPLQKTSRPYEWPALSAEELAIEEWRPIDGYECRYEVSDMGRVRSLPMGPIPIRRGGYKRHFGGLKKPSLDRDGYVRINAKSGGTQKIISVHRAVAKAFLSNPSSLPAVNHIDGNPRNNRLSNLEWVTYKENSRHAVRMGLIKSISPETIYQIIHDYQNRKVNGLTVQSISERYGISRWTVWGIVRKGKKTASENNSLTSQTSASHE